MGRRFTGALALVSCITAVPVWAQDASRCTDPAMLVFDASGSMATGGRAEGGPARIDEARLALRAMLPQITPFRDMGLAVYGPGPLGPCSNIDMRSAPRPDAAQAILAAVDALVPAGHTPLTEAVRIAAAELDERAGRGDVVLVTDGHETCGGAPCSLASTLSGTAITVHVIGFQVRGLSFEWQSTERGDVRNHQTVARCLADRTGGEYVPAETTDALEDALRRILGCPAVG